MVAYLTTTGTPLVLSTVRDMFAALTQRLRLQHNASIWTQKDMVAFEGFIKTQLRSEKLHLVVTRIKYCRPSVSAYQLHRYFPISSLLLELLGPVQVMISTHTSTLSFN